MNTARLPGLAVPAAGVGASPALYGLALALIVSLQFGPLIGLLGHRLQGGPAWAMAGLSRDIGVFLLCLLALGPALGGGRTQAMPVSARWALGMAAAFAVLGLLSDAGMLPLALNLRRLLLVPLLFVAMWLMPWSPRQLQGLWRWALGSSLAVAGLGLLGRLAPQALWTEWLQIEAFTRANLADPFGALPFEESGRFFSWDLERWAGGPVPRAVSSYLEPTTLAAGMAAAVCLALAARARAPGRQPGWWLPLLVACGMLTLSKSFVLFLGVLLCWRWLGAPTPRQVLSLTLAGVAVALLADAAGELIGPLAHIAGLASAVHYLLEGNWLGEGIGAAGNYAAGEFEVGTESGLGNVIAQVGVAALLPLLWVRALAHDVLAQAARWRDPGGPWLAAWLLFWLMSFLFSASSLGVGGNALGFMLLALYLHPAQGRPVLQR